MFAPLGVIEVADHHLQEPLTDAEFEPTLGTLAAAAAAGLGHAAGALLGEVVYGGIVAALVLASRGGAERTLGDVLRELPIMRLVAVDLLWVVVVAAGLVAFVIPGLVFIVWFALVAPVVEIERTGVADAFRRSRQLVRRRFWLVAALVLPLLAIEDSLGSLAQSVSFWGLGDGVIGDWAGSVLANLVTSPPYALAATLLFLGLSERERLGRG